MESEYPLFWRPQDLAFQKCLNWPCANRQNLSLWNDPDRRIRCIRCGDLPRKEQERRAAEQEQQRRARQEQQRQLCEQRRATLEQRRARQEQDRLAAAEQEIHPKKRRKKTSEPPRETPVNTVSRYIFSPDRSSDSLDFRAMRRQYLNETNRVVCDWTADFEDPRTAL